MPNQWNNILPETNKIKNKLIRYFFIKTKNKLYILRYNFTFMRQLF